MLVKQWLMILLLYGFLPLAEVCPERCNLFGLLGNFQRCLQCGSDKFLISYGIFRWQISVSLQAFAFYIFSPRFFGGCIIRLADWICFSCSIDSTDWDKGLPHR